MNNIISLLSSDMYRYSGERRWYFIPISYFKYKGFRFTFWMRLAFASRKIPILRIFPKIFFSFYKLLYNTDLPYNMKIGKGFSIYHVFGTAAHESVVIGDNVTICHNVTLGRRNDKFPIIGNRVYIGPGVTIIGDVYIGDDVLIAPNALVLDDIPNGSIVMGNPAKIISNKGSSQYILNLYEDFMK